MKYMPSISLSMRVRLPKVRVQGTNIQTECLLKLLTSTVTSGMGDGQPASFYKSLSYLECSKTASQNKVLGYHIALKGQAHQMTTAKN